MRRIVAASSLGVWLACPGASYAAEDPPALAPPLTGPSVPSNSAATAPALEGQRLPDGGSVLAVPGVPIRGRNRPATNLPALDPAGPLVSDDLPPLTGPAQMPDAESLPELPDPAIPPGGPESGRPMTLESVPAGDLPDPRPSPRTPSTPPRGSSLRGRLPAARRPSGLFGRIFPPYLGGRTLSDPDDAVIVEPRTDPAADAALKRRLENQIRSAFGEQLRSVEVRVVGRNVVIRARVARFWQRRNIRRSLESLPSLSGYRSTVEVE